MASEYRPKIAVDVQFGAGEVLCLKLAGFEVVVRAEPSEPDWLWFRRAQAAGVEMVCSPDSDLEILAYDHRVRFAKVPGHKRCDLVDLVQREWERLR